MTQDADFGDLSGLHDRLRQARPRSPATHRRVVIVLLDLSATMGYPIAGGDATRPPQRRIDILNNTLQTWLPKVREEGLARLRNVEMAVITFGGAGVRAVTASASLPRDRWHEDGGAFVPAAELDLGSLDAFGTTPMVEAINVSLDLGDARVRHLAGRRVQAEPVRIVMFGDGRANDRRLPADAWRSAAQRIAMLRRQRGVQFFAFAAPGADEAVLRALAGDDDGYVPFAEFDVERLLELILRATADEDPYEGVRRKYGFDSHTAQA